MAITITAEPDDQHAVYTDVVFTDTTDRDDPLVETINDVVEDTILNIGKTILVSAGTTSFDADDVLTGAGFTDTRLNRKYRVLTPSGNSISIDLDWDAAFLNDSGTATKTNDNLKILGDAYKLVDAGNSFTSVVTVAGGSKSRLNVPSGTTAYLAGEILRITGSTNYNGLHIIDKVASTTIDINTAFIANDSGLVYSSDFIAGKRQSGISGNFNFNFANMLQSELSFNIAGLASTGITNTAPSSVMDYGIKFTEEYDGADGLVFTSEQAVSSEHEAINATRQHIDTPAITDYLLQNVTKKFLTNAPVAIAIGDSEHAQLHFIVKDTIGDIQYRVRKFDSSDVQIGSTFISGGFTLVNHRGILSIESSLWDAATAYITVTINTDPGGAVLSQSRRYDIDRRCYHKSERFIWLNRLGGFDGYTFTADKVSDVQSESEIAQRVKQPGFVVTDRGKLKFSVQGEKTYTATSEYVNASTASWLEELYTSPEVYRVSGSDLIPIIITSSGQRIEDSKLIKLSVQYIDANSLVLQNG